jgi:hypothetical protein
METTPASPVFPTAEDITASAALAVEAAALSDALVAWLVEVAASAAPR